MSKPREPIQKMIGELRSWLPNYDHGPNDYPTLLWRLLASMPGGDEAEGMGYEPFQLGWHEVEQLGQVLIAIQDKRDVEDLIQGLVGDEEEEGEVDEASRVLRGHQITIANIQDDVRLQFLVPPENQGHTVEYAYAVAGQYGVIERRTDRSDRSVSYRIHAWTRPLEKWAYSEGPNNSVPPVTGGWKRIQEGRR